MTTSNILESLPAIYPLHFFSLSCNLNCLEKDVTLLPKKKFLLPNTSEYLAEESFADVYMAWNEEGVFLYVDVHKPLEDVSYPDFKKGESIELFFDTRDLKTAGFPTRFCHHFVILPKEVQGIKAQEISKFRAEETHSLCDPDEILTESLLTSKGFSVNIKIPSTILHGFDPVSFDRLGFTYRINRTSAAPQHFALSSTHSALSIEQHPALWSSLKLA